MNKKDTNKIILCRGIQGSGKTTWAKAWVAEDPEHRVRFNNDDIRNMLGPYWIPSREFLVAELREQLLYSAMENGYDIVLDNMNLNTDTVEKEINGYSDQFPVSIEYKNFPTPLETCIERDSKRENPIGKEVITSTYNKYKEGYEWL
jgi:predicted kinase